MIFPRCDGEQAAHRPEERRLAGAVGAEEGDDAASGHVEADAPEDEDDVAVDDLDVAHAQERIGHRCDRRHPNDGFYYRSASMNMTFRDSNASMHWPAPSTTHSSGSSTRCTGMVGLLGKALVEAAQHAPAADEVDALHDQVLGQLGRRHAEALDDRVDDGAHLLLDGVAHLLGREHDGLGQAAHEVAAAHLGLHLVHRRWALTDGDLDLLGRALADGDAVLAPDVGLDGGVHVEAADADRLQRDDAAQGDDGGLAGAAADVHDHVAERLADRQAGADGCGHRLVDEVGVGRAGPTGRLLDGPLLDAR